MKPFKEYALDDKLDKLVIDQIKKRKLAKYPVNATDDIRMRMSPNNPAFQFPYKDDYMIHVFLRPMSGPKGAKKGDLVAFNYSLEDK